MKLKKLLKQIEVENIVGSIEHIDIKKLCDNTKEVSDGSLFIAIKGLRVDAHYFCEEAKKLGAVALVVEHEVDSTLPQIIVKNTRVTLSKLAHNFYKKILKKIKIVSVVGTNGKTSTAHFIKDILTYHNIKVGVIGTNGILINEELLPHNLTTPDTLNLFLLFQKMVEKKVKIVVMEVSAHAIYLNKVNGFLCAVAAFTNFSEDHLDFFKTLENYKSTKLSYFTKEFCKNAVVNIDDEVGQELVLKTNLKTLTYGILNKNANISAKNMIFTVKNSVFDVFYHKKSKNVAINVPSSFNVYNALCAVGVASILLKSYKKAIQGVSNIRGVNGRFKNITVDKNCSVIIDYAHTEKAMENLMLEVKKIYHSKLICVFGCPGVRDQFKRQEMGLIAGKFCDEVIVTSDNPDIENPLIIFDQILRGVKKTKCNYVVIENRSEAIQHALNLRKFDEKTCILILGKGSETYQIINQMNVPYNDEEEVLKQIK